MLSGVGSAVGALILAGRALYRRRLPLLRRGPEPDLLLAGPIRRFQSGVVNDYITWIVIGAACIGGYLVAGRLGAREHRGNRPLLDRVAAQTGTVRTALADQGFKNAVAAYGATLGIDVQIAGRNPVDKGFVPQPRRPVSAG